MDKYGVGWGNLKEAPGENIWHRTTTGMKEEDYKKREERCLKKMLGKYNRKGGSNLPGATAKYERG